MATLEKGAFTQLQFPCFPCYLPSNSTYLKMSSTFTLVRVPSFDWSMDYFHQRCQFLFGGNRNFAVAVDYCDNPDTVIVTYTIRGDYNLDGEDDYTTEYYTLEGAGSAAQYTLRDLLNVVCQRNFMDEYRLEGLNCFEQEDVNVHNYLDTPISRLPIAQFDIVPIHPPAADHEVPLPVHAN